MSGKRDNNYYLNRLKLEAPAVHRDLLAGKLKSPAEAFRTAGLKRPRTRLNELKNAWDKATAAERKAFLRWLGVTATAVGGSVVPVGSSVASATPKPKPASSAIAGCTLSEEAKRRINAILSGRSIKAGQAMREMGFDALNPSLGLALHRGTKVQPEVTHALDKWIDDNSDHLS